MNYCDLLLVILFLTYVRLIYVSTPHNSKTLADTLFGCLMDYNLDINLSTLTRDNCSINDVMIERILKKI